MGCIVLRCEDLTTACPSLSADMLQMFCTEVLKLMIALVFY
jgi:hypothetical protein